VRSRHKMSMRYFPCSGGPGAVSIKCARTCYSELMFLHSVGSIGDLVLSGVFGA
jgi:hypothetical protein